MRINQVPKSKRMKKSIFNKLLKYIEKVSKKPSPNMVAVAEEYFVNGRCKADAARMHKVTPQSAGYTVRRFEAMLDRMRNDGS